MSYSENLRNKAKNSFGAAYFLYEQSEHYDWAVTISFYACLNIVKYKAFPLEYEKYHFATFEEFYDQWGGEGTVYSNKHTCIQHLTRELSSLKTINQEYRQLFDLSQTSRYDQYACSKEMAEEAIVLMKQIFKQCDTNKPKPKK